MKLLRSTIYHAYSFDRWESFEDGGLVVHDGRIVACGDYATVSREYPEAPVTDWRGGYLLPGFVDAHIHFPQLRVIGGLGMTLLDWLDQHALPEEVRVLDVTHAARVARGFVSALAAHGTTTALVFGAHSAAATAELFSAAAASGLRVLSGMIFSDRMLRPELHQKVETAYADATELVRQFHGKGRLLYAVTPRFALSCSDAMLEMCGSLMAEHEGLRFQSHVNENPQEIAEVLRLFPWAADYFGVYERYGLSGPGAVLAHNVHSGDGELDRMAASRTSVTHCPCSNAALGSGIFPMARHLKHGVHFGLGTDVGGGTGFGMLKEALQACLLQRLTAEGIRLSAGQLLYLATLAGAEAVGLDATVGNLAVGKAADLVYLRAPVGGPLEFSLEGAESALGKLAALFTQAGAESVREVWVEGDVVHRA